MKPPDVAVTAALRAAAMSPCAKSKRGVAAFVAYDDSTTVIATGFNGPSGPFMCDGSDACRNDCSKRCVHAEMRCIRTLASHHWRERVQLVHVKLNEPDTVARGGNPSCWQCSREILDSGLAGVWLFQLDSGWRFYSAIDFHTVTSKTANVFLGHMRS